MSHPSESPEQDFPSRARELADYLVRKNAGESVENHPVAVRHRAAAERQETLINMLRDIDFPDAQPVLDFAACFDDYPSDDDPSAFESWASFVSRLAALGLRFGRSEGKVFVTHCSDHVALNADAPFVTQTAHALAAWAEFTRGLKGPHAWFVIAGFLNLALVREQLILDWITFHRSREYAQIIAKRFNDLRNLAANEDDHPEQIDDCCHEGKELAGLLLHLSQLFTQSTGRAAADQEQASGRAEAVQSFRNPTRPPTMDWQTVQRRLLAMYGRGVPWPGVTGLVRTLHCGRATISKAVNQDDSGRLRRWMNESGDRRNKNGSVPAARECQLNEVSLSQTVQPREPDPAEAADLSERDAVLARLLDQATPEERAKLNAMPADKLQELIDTYRSPCD